MLAVLLLAVACTGARAACSAKDAIVWAHGAANEFEGWFTGRDLKSGNAPAALPPRLLLICLPADQQRQHRRTRAGLRIKGYRPVYVSRYTSGNQIFVNAAMLNKPGASWIAEWNVRDWADEEWVPGTCTTWLSAYSYGGEDYFSSLAEECDVDQKATTGMNTSTFLTKNLDMYKQGYALRTFAAYGGVCRWCVPRLLLGVLTLLAPDDLKAALSIQRGVQNVCRTCAKVCCCVGLRGR
jgi:hypothetical protein